MKAIKSADQNASAFAIDTRDLVNAGTKIPINEVWTYAAMRSVVRRKIDGGDHALQVALNRLARDHGIEFKNVRGVGYQRLDDEGIVDHLPADRSKIRRVVRRSRLRAANIKDYDALPNEAKLNHDLHAATIGVIQVMFKSKTMKRIRAEAERVHGEIDSDRVLSVFRRAKAVEEDI